MSPRDRLTKTADRFVMLWYRWTYCRHHGHLDKGWGYCANCGKDQTP